MAGQGPEPAILPGGRERLLLGDKDDIFALVGKVGLVTGAARNIGRAIAEGLARSSWSAAA